MANKEHPKLTKGIVGYGASLKAFRRNASMLTGEFTFSAAVSDRGYRVLHGLAVDDVENLIAAQSTHPITVLHVWAVYR